MIETEQGWLFKGLDGQWYISAYESMHPLYSYKWDVWQVHFEWWAHEDIGEDE